MKLNIFLIIFCILLLIPFVSAEITRDEALTEIQKAHDIMGEMVFDGLPIISVNDSIIAAYDALERADFANILLEGQRGIIAERAKKALRGLDYKGFSYDDVLTHTNNVKNLRDKAYYYLDQIGLLRLKIDEYAKEGVDTTFVEGLYIKINNTFYKERYNELEELIEQANMDLENKRSEQSTLNVLLLSSRGFFEKNWQQLLIIFVVLIIAIFVFWKRYRIWIMKKKLEKLKVEEKSLQQLMKETQKSRYQKNNMSLYVYNLRMDKYTDRLNEVRQDIPVLTEILKKEKKKKTKSKKNKAKSAKRKKSHKKRKTYKKKNKKHPKNKSTKKSNKKNKKTSGKRKKSKK